MTRGLLLVAVVALLARASFELAVSRDAGAVGALAGHLLGDERAYDAFARQSAAGTLHRERAFYQEPLYAWLLGRVYAVFPPAPLVDDPSVVPHDDVHRFVILIQHGLGVAVALLTTVLGTAALGRRPGLLAGLLAALSGPAIFHEAMLLKATLSLVVMLVALLQWLDLLRRDDVSARRALATGIVLGLGVLLRGNLYLLAALVVLSLVVPFGTRRRRPGAAALVAAGVLLAVLPATLHNLQRGDLVLTTYQAGTNVALGQPDNDDPVAGVIYEPLRAGRGDARYEELDAVAFAETAVGRRLGGREVSAWWWREALRRVAKRPGVAAARVGLKLAHLFHPSELPDVKEWSVFALAVPWLATPLSTLVIVGPWALLGLLFLPWRGNPGLVVVRSTLLVVAVTLGLFYVMGRYRLTAAPALWILAAGAADAGWRVLAAPGHALRKLLVVLAGVGLPLVGVLLPLPPDVAPGAVSLSNAASIAKSIALDAPDAATATRQRDLAVAWAGQALVRAPDFVDANTVRLHALAMKRPDLPDRGDEARDQAWRLLLVLEGQRTGVGVRTSLQRDEAGVREAALQLMHLPAAPGGLEFTAPMLSEACLGLEPYLHSADDLSLALQLAERAAAFAPHDTAPMVQRGVVLRRLGRLAEAEASYRAAVAAGDESLELFNNLGNLLIQEGRADEALAVLERALELAPDHPVVLKNLARARAAHR